MWIAELKADNQASVIQQQPVTISEQDFILRVTRTKYCTAPRAYLISVYLLVQEANITSQKAGMSDRVTGSWRKPPKLFNTKQNCYYDENSQQGPTSSNYRPVTCLSRTLKLWSGIIADENGVQIYGYIHQARIGIGSESRRLKHKLSINQS